MKFRNFFTNKNVKKSNDLWAALCSIYAKIWQKWQNMTKIWQKWKIWQKKSDPPWKNLYKWSYIHFSLSKIVNYLFKKPILSLCNIVMNSHTKITAIVWPKLAKISVIWYFSQHLWSLRYSRKILHFTIMPPKYPN